MPRGNHDEGEFYHIRLKNPDALRNMKTTNFGHLKKVRGINKQGEWVDQNIMVNKRNAKPSGSKLIIKTKKLKERLKEEGILLSSIVRRKSGGKMDYKAKKVKCPGSKIRSRGKGQGLGRGKGKGPIGRHRQ